MILRRRHVDVPPSDGENLYYSSSLPYGYITPCYNGNISAMSWTYSSQTLLNTYEYDQMNRLRFGGDWICYENSEMFQYDKHGNITHLERTYDNQKDGGLDDLYFTYDGNRVKSITDYAGSRNSYNVKEYQDLASLATEFDYDKNGNMTMDLDRNIAAIRYNLLNLPDTVQFMNGNQIINRYDATGRKLKTEYVTAPSGVIIPVSGTVNSQGSGFTRYGTIYNGSMEYRLGNWGDVTLARIHNPEGYVEYNTPDDGFEGNIQELNHYSYYRKDHLGNVREVWSAPYHIGKDNGTTQAFGAYTSQRTQYYPSGLPWKSNTGDNPNTQPYKYNGKEFVETHGFNELDYQARGMYPAIMRFGQIDPLAEKYYSVSPYAYCANNPIRYVDYRGDSISLAGMQGLDKALGTNYVGQITSDLQAQTGLTITVGADGKMSYAKDKNGNPIIATTKDANGKTVQVGSATARTFMTGAIDHADMVDVSPGARSGVPPGTNTVGLNYKQIESFVNGSVGMDSRSLGWGMTLMHELHHTQVGGGLADSPGNPGPVVNQMNIIRSELGGNYGQRLDYYGTPIGGNVFIPFNRSAKESIILFLPPSTVRPGQQYIKF